MRQPMVLFRLNADWFGANATHVLEVVVTPPITALPFTPPHLRGVAAVRGELLSVIDLHMVLQQSSPPTAPTRLVVVAVDAVEAGFLVDEVTDVITVEREIDTATITWQGHAVRLLEIPEVLQNTRLHRGGAISARTASLPRSRSPR